jgi:hypothetical protein
MKDSKLRKAILESLARRGDPEADIEIRQAPTPLGTWVSFAGGVIHGPDGAMIDAVSRGGNDGKALRGLAFACGLRPDGSDPAVDDPSLDGTDAAHPAWWRGHDRASEAWREKAEKLTRDLDMAMRACCNIRDQQSAEAKLNEELRATIRAMIDETLLARTTRNAAVQAASESAQRTEQVIAENDAIRAAVREHLAAEAAILRAVAEDASAGYGATLARITATRRALEAMLREK